MNYLNSKTITEKLLAVRKIIADRVPLYSVADLKGGRAMGGSPPFPSSVGGFRPIILYYILVLRGLCRLREKKKHVFENKIILLTHYNRPSHHPRRISAYSFICVGLRGSTPYLCTGPDIEGRRGDPGSIIFLGVFF